MKRVFMALSHLDEVTNSYESSPRGPSRSYFAAALYVLSGAIIAAGVALSWSWLTGDGLLPIVVFVPCM
jgi:hypothetical protein